MTSPTFGNPLQKDTLGVPPEALLNNIAGAALAKGFPTSQAAIDTFHQMHPELNQEISGRTR